MLNRLRGKMSLPLKWSKVVESVGYAFVVVYIAAFALLIAGVFSKNPMTGLQSSVLLLVMVDIPRIPVVDDEKIKELEAENRFLRRLLNDPEFRKGVITASCAMEKSDAGRDF